MKTSLRENLAAAAGRAKSLLHQRDGALTRELVLSPGLFGLGKVPASRQPDATTSSVCGFCSTGCGLNLHLAEGEAINLTPSTEYTVNLGMACPKGWEALTVLDSTDRAEFPLAGARSGSGTRISWSDALQTFCERMKSIQHQYGPEATAFLSTGQLPNEEMLMLGCLAKFGMGMVHGDGNTRQCMATAVTAYKQSFGFDAPPYTYADFEESDVIVLVGANLCIAHPIMWERVCRNRHNPEIIVVDPRTTETAVAATLHLDLKPKSDLELFYGLANILIGNGWIDRDFVEAHTSGFEEFAAHVANFDLDRVTMRTGINADTLNRVAEMIHQGQRVSFWWTMGVNQSYEGTRTAQSLINLALMTGNIGRPGTGANSITGQCNAMGSRLFSNTTSLPAGRDFENATDRAEVASILGVEDASIPTQNSWSYDRIIEGVRTGEIRGLWIIATNPAHSWIDQHDVKQLLGQLDFLVVQDMYHSTETAQVADLLLPAAGWGEKAGTFINSERRIGTIKKVRRAPGEALADFAIFKLIAEAWGCGHLFSRWDTPEAVFQSMKELSRGKPCDITGIAGYDMIDQCQGIQWPYTDRAEAESRERRLFEDGGFYHGDGRAKFICESPRPLPEQTDDDYPLLLLTGRGSVAQWHTQTRTAKSRVLLKLSNIRCYVEIHPSDARHIGIRNSDEVTVTSRRGEVRAIAFVSPTVRPGVVFMPMHDATVNQLTLAHFDPYSRQPSYKNCAVRIHRVSS